MPMRVTYPKTVNQMNRQNREEEQEEEDAGADGEDDEEENEEKAKAKARTTGEECRARAGRGVDEKLKDGG